MESLLIKPV